MSDSGHGEHARADHGTATKDAAGQPVEGFTPNEVDEFMADDVHAGANIGRMLVALFCYSLVAGAIVTWWAWEASK